MFGLCLTPCKSATKNSESACKLRIRQAFDDYEYYQDGDVIIGGVFTVHSAVQDFQFTKAPLEHMICMAPFYLWYAHVRIFLFTIEQINNNKEILPNITLGYHLYDSCLDTRKAVKSVLQILSGPGKTIPNYSCSERGKVAGFIGDHYSVTTVPIAQILGIYGHTQISYGATDYSLSDRRVYPHFFRALQNERVHFLIIADLLKHFGWTWVGIFTSDDDGGNQQSLILTKYLNDQGICVAYTIHSNKGIKNDLHHISEIVRKSSAQVIVICGPLTYASISTLLVLKDIFHSKTLILPPSWASKEEVFLANIGTFNGSLGIELFPIFFSGPENYFKDIKPSKFPNDGLLADIYSLYLQCLSLSSLKNKMLNFFYRISLQNCTGKESLGNLGMDLFTGVSPRVHFAVNVMAHAVESMNLNLNTAPYKREKRTNFKHQYNLPPTSNSLKQLP
ncbi:vomeronasal type-2 receptor 1-like [Spea bombifrons]|uniref:vomeronasal type-2 receptor 1-like n=1 Tax=Spea bombifrons TaxID=233779 RepID=UPI00234A963A|nr:vomeronasal type-2 receptor 1-like [Spea bombifrons]